MYKVTRGLAVIINVQCVGARQRRGTDIDAKVLAHLFRSLHFEVIQYDDDDGLSAKVGKSRFLVSPVYLWALQFLLLRTQWKYVVRRNVKGRMFY